jgi:hypothetical protein
MSELLSALRLFGGMATTLAALSASRAAGAVPELADVRQIVETSFKARRDFHDGDLITLGDVAPILAQLEKQGFDVRRKEQGAVMLLADGHPFARLLNSSEGAKLATLLRGKPEAYDRLSRLCSFAAGREMVMTLARAADEKMLATLCSPEAAAELEAMYPDEPACRNLATASGLVYTVEQWVEHLETMHTLAVRNLSRPGE